MLQEEEVTKENLFASVTRVYNKRQDYIAAMERSQLNNSIEKIVGLIDDAARKGKKK